MLSSDYKENNNIRKTCKTHSPIMVKKIGKHQNNWAKSLEEGKDRLQTAENNLENGRSQLEQAEVSLENARRTSDRSTRTTKVKPRDSWQKLRKNGDKKKKKLAQTESDLTKEKKKLEQRQKDLDELAEPKYHVYNRQTMPGGQRLPHVQQCIINIRSVGNIFPVVLYMVAAMVTFTTMTHFVDEERTNASIFRRPRLPQPRYCCQVCPLWFLAGTVGTIVGTFPGTLSPCGRDFGCYNSWWIVVGKVQGYFYWSYSLIA